MEKQSNILKMSGGLVYSTTFLFIIQFLVNTLKGAFMLGTNVWRFGVLVILFFTLLGMINEYQSVKFQVKNTPEYSKKEMLPFLLVVTVVTLLTYLMTYYLGATTIFSASLICVLAAFLFPKKYESAIYSASIGGMVSSALYGNLVAVLFVAALITFYYLFCLPSFCGVGGRGGMMAYMGSVTLLQLFIMKETTVSLPLEKAFYLPSIVSLTLVAIITYLLHTRGFLSNVKAAMIMALLVEVLLPVEWSPIISAAFAGTIIGMSSLDNVKNIAHLIVISLICSFLFVSSYHVLGGIAGKFGILSVVGYTTTDGIFTFIRYFRDRETDELVFK